MLYKCSLRAKVKRSGELWITEKRTFEGPVMLPECMETNPGVQRDWFVRAIGRRRVSRCVVLFGALIRDTQTLLGDEDYDFPSIQQVHYYDRQEGQAPSLDLSRRTDWSRTTWNSRYQPTAKVREERLHDTSVLSDLRHQDVPFSWNAGDRRGWTDTTDRERGRHCRNPHYMRGITDTKMPLDYPKQDGETIQGSAKPITNQLKWQASPRKTEIRDESLSTLRPCRFNDRAKTTELSCSGILLHRRNRPVLRIVVNKFHSWQDGAPTGGDAIFSTHIRMIGRTGTNILVEDTGTWHNRDGYDWKIWLFAYYYTGGIYTMTLNPWSHLQCGLMFHYNCYRQCWK